MCIFVLMMSVVLVVFGCIFGVLFELILGFDGKLLLCFYWIKDCDVGKI